MLITITIIGILAAGVTAALQGARETAKAAKTKTTITKLHYVIMARYDSYRTRRVPVDTKGLPPQQAALVRVNAIRDLIRMEMPDRWSDVYRENASGVTIPTPLVLQDQPSISLRYLRLGKKGSAGVASQNMPSAEFLYMIVMAIPEAAEQFQNTEIGDYDGDGLPEFIDGWGRPIKLLRWPVGFYNALEGDSDLHPNDPTDPSNPCDPDTFDPQNIIGGYATFPLIYSAGPDGKYDINTGYKANGDGYEYFLDGNSNLNPFQKDGATYYIGQPLNRGGGLGSESVDPANLYHYDNIHNHRLEVR
jgi:hypothetical protein